MFDVAPSELLLVAIVALLVIGPKDLPLALRTVGRWVGKMRRMSGHFRAGIDTMIREAELAEIEKEWRERNERIMAEHPDGEAMAPFDIPTPATYGYDVPPVPETPAVDGPTTFARAKPVQADGTPTGSDRTDADTPLKPAKPD